ncbi:TolB-like protein [Rhizobium sp. ERR 1071]|uniref:tetratricopeptide repeat protein n=1 Tax=Rhizobium sp. ERR 1071 TaxID=2572677 RepID=UPI00119BB08A|nr:adenylate/guanylate cyclase domain-containing protein [Rhizobium sp. ERR1071]TWB19568.1 TolB-like protein [Rhizobium sp. ERR1071]
MAEPLRRRLTAIMATDIVGYSRLMEADEEQTLASLRRLHDVILGPQIRKHGGRVIKFMGDGLLSVFDGANDVASCALEIQHCLGTDVAPKVGDERIRLRIGINLAEVVVTDDDIFGDGVNVAARLERQAPPGGICLGDAAYVHLKPSTRALFKNGGEVRLKNITKLVRAWYWPEAPAPIVADKTAVAVLPFRNMEGGAEQSFFCDGFTEDIIGSLARFRRLSVIAASSSFAFRDLLANPAEIGGKLGASYVVTGDLRRSERALRARIQLIETSTGRLIWSEKYDRRDTDIFEVQDEIVRMIASNLVGQIDTADYQQSFRKPPDNLAAYEFYLRGLVYLRGYEPDDNIKACEMFEAALARDQGFALAHAHLAFSRLATHGYAKAPVSVLQECNALARKAISLDEGEAGCHRALALAYFYSKDFEGAERELRRACMLNPSDANAIVQLGGLLARRNRIDEAMQWIEEGMRLNPFPPHWYYAVLGNALYLKGDYDEALAAFRRLPNPGKFTRARVVACLNKAGRLNDAVAEARDLLAIHPDFTVSDFLAHGIVVESEQQRELFRGGLDQVGLSD